MGRTNLLGVLALGTIGVIDLRIIPGAVLAVDTKLRLGFGFGGGEEGAFGGGGVVPRGGGGGIFDLETGLWATGVAVCTALPVGM